MTSYRRAVADRLAREQGTLVGHGRRAVALVYPSPYLVGMASLGFQQVYRMLNALPDTTAARAFRPEPNEPGGARRRGPVLCYEDGRPVGDFPVVAFSVASEIEILGVFDVLERSGIPVRAAERGEAHPWVVIGGPLTYSNPRPLAPFADVIVLGEAEELVGPLCDVLFGGMGRQAALRELAAKGAGYYVPSEHGASVPELARAADALLPATSAIRTTEAALGSMAMVEAERGCSRGCTFCVMRRSTNGGMRLIPPERVLAALPADARRVGLVGAAVSDHPQLIDIIKPLVERGCQVALSSLRADRLTLPLAELLIRGGARTLTIAADGASERLRERIDKGITARHLQDAARLAGELGLSRLKCYVMVGMPGEADADIDELVGLASELACAAGLRTRIVIGVSTFVPKLRTPLAKAAFAGSRAAGARIARLRRAVPPQVELRAGSPRWAWVEYVLAQGGPEVGLGALAAWRGGGCLSSFKAAFAPFQDARGLQEESQEDTIGRRQ